MTIALTAVAHGEVHIAQQAVEPEDARIGSAVNFEHEGVQWAGRVIDIRHNWTRPETRTLFVAVLGWPNLFCIVLPAAVPEK